MKRRIKGLVMLLVILLTTTAVFSATNDETIAVVFDKIGIKINGENMEQRSMTYEDTTYVPLRAFAEMLGKKVSWDQAGSLVCIDNYEAQTLSLKNKVDAYNPKISLEELDLSKEMIEAIEIEMDGQTQFVKYEINSNEILLKNYQGNIQNVLPLGKECTLKVFTKGNATIKATFITAQYPEIVETGEYTTYYIEAMPEKGFNYPYVISLPSNQYKEKNQGKERYLLVEPNNFGQTSNNLEDHVDDALKGIYDQVPSYRLQEELWLPRLMPIFPRPDLYFDRRGPYTHSLDSYTIFMDEWFLEDYQDSSYQAMMARNGIIKAEVEKMYNLDEQLNAMMDHAIELLNANDQNVNEEKVFMYGFSASGNYVNRYIALYPERVKAAYSGAVNSIVMMPADSYQGDRLMYPVGTADNEKITGKPFDMEAYNRVAKIFYMGGLDRNDTLDYSTPYEQNEKDLIIKHFGRKMLPTRWENTQEVFFELGCTGAFVTNEMKGHGGDSDDSSYMIKVFDLNRETETPVYPAIDSDHVRVRVK